MQQSRKKNGGVEENVKCIEVDKHGHIWVYTLPPKTHTVKWAALLFLGDENILSAPHNEAVTLKLCQPPHRAACPRFTRALSSFSAALVSVPFLPFPTLPNATLPEPCENLPFVVLEIFFQHFNCSSPGEPERERSSVAAAGLRSPNVRAVSEVSIPSWK